MSLFLAILLAAGAADAAADSSRTNNYVEYVLPIPYSLAPGQSGRPALKASFVYMLLRFRSYFLHVGSATRRRRGQAAREQMQWHDL